MFWRKKSKVNSIPVPSSVVPYKVNSIVQGKAEVDPIASDLKRLMNYNGMKIQSINIRDDCVEICLERDNKQYKIVSSRISLVDSDGMVIDTSVPNWSGRTGISGIYTSTSSTFTYSGKNIP